MDRIRNKTIRTKIEIRNTYYRKQKKCSEDGTAISCEWRTAELLNKLQNRTDRGEVGE
jgi:hypothetical protein